ncbi:hypothetical protein KIW84_040521 [Lathyrus oleraceus]|uniref:Putative plant transposon protein domain-containing protein n=1 Tax=Pisum sativum TaxID=3888 RepID=A0A9D4X5G5_PEA|nr:hypothetical protein KIW84_040521 [Pisum sativum]
MVHVVRFSEGEESYFKLSNPAFNRAKFLGAEQEARYAELASRSIWLERTFNINPQGYYRGFLSLIEGKNWHKLLIPPTYLNYDIVSEFYSKALPIEGMRHPFTTFVRGKEVSFTRYEINDYIDNPLTLEEGEKCAYYKRVCRADWNIELIKEALILPGRSYVVNASGLLVKFLRKDMNVHAQVLMNLLLYNIKPMSHTSSIPIDTAYLLYYILDEKQVDATRVISNEIIMISSSGHRWGTRTPTTLAFL